MKEVILHCCECEKFVKPRLTSGAEIYPHRPDLAELPFWKCDCGNFVGCHHKTKDRTKPLGCIPNAAIKGLRKSIHSVLDPIWQSGITTRQSLYAELTKLIGRKYHTAELKNIEECKQVLAYLEGY